LKIEQTEANFLRENQKGTSRGKTAKKLTYEGGRGGEGRKKSESGDGRKRREGCLGEVGSTSRGIK